MKKFWLFIKDVVVIFIVALVLAVLLKTFVVDNRIIPSSSMAPTVEPGSRILVNRFIYNFNDVEAGDIIVFEPTESTKIDLGMEDDLLKRVIGLPGDEIQITDGELYINGTEMDESYIAETMTYEYGPITVPDDCVFVLGDNRNYSADSHVWTDPFVPIDNIKGKAFFIYWPFDHFGKLE